MLQALETLRSGRHTLIFDTAVCEALSLPVPGFEWLQSDYWLARQQSTASSGRGQAVLIDAPYPMVLRTYCRGGLIRHFSQQRFIYNGLTSTRPFRELSLLNKMHQAGLPVPRGIAGRVSRFGISYEATILMERIPNSQEVHTQLLSAPLSDLLWNKIGRIIRQLHDAQVYHHDLNIHNILIDQDEKFWLIDFDKCSEKSGENWKAQNLARLERSLQKEQTKHADYHFSVQNWQSLLSGYAGTVAS